MREVPKMTEVDILYGSIKHLPLMEEIPDEFKEYNGTVWNKIISRWFFSGLPDATVFYPKESIVAENAIAAIGAILVSFAPKHEHKEAGAAYLLSEWFEKVEGWENE